MDTRQSREIGQKAAKKSNRRGYVYFIEAVGDPNRRHKIGRTKKPKERFNTLKNQSPYQHQVLQCIECSDYVATEKKLHKYFDKFRVQGTEWFELTPIEVDRVIQLMKSFDESQKFAGGSSASVNNSNLPINDSNENPLFNTFITLLILLVGFLFFKQVSSDYIQYTDPPQPAPEFDYKPLLK